MIPLPVALKSGSYVRFYLHVFPHKKQTMALTQKSSHIVFKERSAGEEPSCLASGKVIKSQPSRQGAPEAQAWYLLEDRAAQQLQGTREKPTPDPGTGSVLSSRPMTQCLVKSAISSVKEVNSQSFLADKHSAFSFKGISRTRTVDI